MEVDKGIYSDMKEGTYRITINAFNGYMPIGFFKDELGKDKMIPLAYVKNVGEFTDSGYFKIG